MTTKNIEVGQITDVWFDGLQVRCKVIATRRSYGRTDVCVTPVEGSGAIWVDVKRVFSV